MTVITRPEVTRTVISKPSPTVVVSTPDTKVVVAKSEVIRAIVSKPEPEKVVVRGTGARGPVGPPSPGIPPFIQVAPSASWIIGHNLGRIPSIDVVIDGEVVLADVFHPDVNNSSVVLAEPAPGVAVLR
jgi:hypothetical protein